MSKFYPALLALILLLSACTKKAEDLTFPEGKIGEWSVYITDSTAMPLGPWDLNLYQNRDTIYGQLCNETLSGVVVGDTIVFTIGDSTALSPVTYKGRIIDKTISGIFSYQNGGNGTWIGTSEYMHQNYSRYYVFGGNVPFTFTDEVGYHPERFGFTVLGSAKTTATFQGDFPYYIILTYPDNTAKVDAVGCDGGVWFETYFTGQVFDRENIGTPPDTKYAVLGKIGFVGEVSPGGFVGIDASGVTHSSLTVYICE